MKKYRLIREYPGSPELGTIAENKNGITYSNNNETWSMCSTEEDYFNKMISSQPEYWQEIVEKEYEILSIKCKATGGDLIYTNNNKGYFTVGLGSISLEDVYLGHLKGSKDIKINIYSVKRLSDGEVFTIGDRVKYINNHVITKFEFIESSRDIKVCFDTTYNWVWLGGNQIYNLIKTKQPLFTTEDGVDMFESDTFYYLTHKSEASFPNIIQEFTALKEYDFSEMTFSTKEKAEEYIIMNKPCLSLNDIIEFGNDPIMGIPYRSIDKYKTLVKEKLNL